jgi:hypothetical protein
MGEVEGTGWQKKINIQTGRTVWFLVHTDVSNDNSVITLRTAQRAWNRSESLASERYEPTAPPSALSMALLAVVLVVTEHYSVKNSCLPKLLAPWQSPDCIPEALTRKPSPCTIIQRNCVATYWRAQRSARSPWLKRVQGLVLSNFSQCEFPIGPLQQMYPVRCSRLSRAARGHIFKLYIILVHSVVCFTTGP